MWRYKDGYVRQELYSTADYRAEKTGGTDDMNEAWYLDFIHLMEEFFDWLSQDLHKNTGQTFVRPPSLTKLIPRGKPKIGGTTIIYEIDPNGGIAINGFIW